MIEYYEVKGEYGCYIAFNYTTCKEAMDERISMRRRETFMILLSLPTPKKDKLSPITLPCLRSPIKSGVNCQNAT